MQNWLLNDYELFPLRRMSGPKFFVNEGHKVHVIIAGFRREFPAGCNRWPTRAPIT